MLVRVGQGARATPISRDSSHVKKITAHIQHAAMFHPTARITIIGKLAHILHALIMGEGKMTFTAMKPD